MSRPNTKGIEDIGNPNFLNEVELMVATHKAKAAGYSGSDNPDTWANFREATAWGQTPLNGCLIRMGDKYRRVQNLRRDPDNDRVGESIKDTLRDLANYALIAVCLIIEEEAEAGRQITEARLKSPVPPGGFGPTFREPIKPGSDTRI